MKSSQKGHQQVALARPGVVCRVRSRRNDYEWTGPIRAYWEADCDPISDDYTPDDISAEDLLMRWVEKYRDRWTGGLIPISWCADSSESAKFEAMPFQSGHGDDRKNFLTYYDWPLVVETGELLNWLEVPVIDKLWNAKHCNKGGFIQEATGWKPAILQPFVFLPSLLQAVDPG